MTRGIRDVALAAAAYSALVVLLTWPLATEMGTSLFGDFGDTRGWAWWVWAQQQGLLAGGYTPLLGAPHGVHFDTTVVQPVSEGLVRALAAASHPIAAINAFVMLALALTATATFAALRRLLPGFAAPFFGGLAFGFAPAAIMQAAGGHAAYTFNPFLPLFVLALLWNRERRSFASAAAVAASFAAITFTALYIGYLAIFAAAYCVVFDLLTRGDVPARRIAANYALCALIAAAMVLPVEMAAIARHAGGSGLERSHDIAQLHAFGARAWNYLVPPIDHPVLGAALRDFARANLHGSNLFEQTLYAGWTCLVLVTVGVVMVLRGRMDARSRALFLFFTGGAAWMVLVSLPPLIGGGIPTPSYFAYAFAPMFRVYARAGIWAQLFVACAAAVVLAVLASRRGSRSAAILPALATALLAFEFWTLPPGHASRLEPPEVYRWLAREPGDFIVAEYPMAHVDEAAHYTYPFWQRIHRKRLVNGALPSDPKAWQLYEGARDLEAPGAVEWLARSGVRYVIVHRAMYREGPIPEPLKRYYSPQRAAQVYGEGIPPRIPPGLRPVAAFGPDVVYEVVRGP